MPTSRLHITSFLHLATTLVVHHPRSALARGFLPTFANGYGFLVPSPAGGIGCGCLNYINCFPEVTETLTRWSGQLQAVYASPAAYEPASKVTIQSSKTVIDDNANLLVAQTADGVKEEKKRNDYAYHQLQLVHKEVPAVFLLETRGDVFAEVSANHVPDAATALSKFQAMSDVARALQDAAILGMMQGTEHVASVTTAAAVAGQDKVKKEAALLLPLSHHHHHDKVGEG